MTKYRISVSIDGENFFWIVVDNEKFIRNPTKEDLMGTKLKSYNNTNICPRCREGYEREGCKLTDKSILYPKNALRERDIVGNETCVCKKCYSRDDYIERFKVGHRRTGNLDPSSNQAKGDNSQELACILYGWVDLNKKNDNHNSPIDCYDPKTGLYHQVRGKSLRVINRYITVEGEEIYYEGWMLGGLEIEWGKKKYEGMVCFCFSEDWEIIERIYRPLWEEIMRVKGITVYKNPIYVIPWYEKYRVTDEDELKKANDIWAQILEKRWK